jgi:hypothetical protein
LLILRASCDTNKFSRVSLVACRVVGRVVVGVLSCERCIPGNGVVDPSPLLGDQGLGLLPIVHRRAGNGLPQHVDGTHPVSLLAHGDLGPVLRGKELMNNIVKIKL